VGLDVLLDNDAVRVWDVSLSAGGVQSWHHHHNPYVVLSVEGSEGRVDSLDGSPPRFISEYRGGAIHRPVSPIHQLTNIGHRFYRCRLVELKHLGEYLPAPFDIGEGARSVEGEPIGPQLDDGREQVINHRDVRVWSLTLDPGQSRALALNQVLHLVATLDATTIESDPNGGVRSHDGGRLTLTNDSANQQSWFITELTYLTNLEAILRGDPRD
jgi:hypothetical protein